MLGSLSVYRRVLNDNVFHPMRYPGETQKKLPVVGHAMAGVMAGWTVSFIAGPVEHIKARLQVQYAADKSKRLYKGPIDCLKKVVRLLIPWPPMCCSHRAVQGPWHPRRMARPKRYSPLPNLLLLLVGIV